MPINTAPQIEPANFLNLLIVDDERAIREACREVAIPLGFSAHIADSAEQAFRALDAQNFDAVLLDLACPAEEAWMLCAVSRNAVRKLWWWL